MKGTGDSTLIPLPHRGRGPQFELSGIAARRGLSGSGGEPNGERLLEARPRSFVSALDRIPGRLRAGLGVLPGRRRGGLDGIELLFEHGLVPGELAHVLVELALHRLRGIGRLALQLFRLGVELEHLVFEPALVLLLLVVGVVLRGPRVLLHARPRTAAWKRDGGEEHDQNRAQRWAHEPRVEEAGPVVKAARAATEVW